MTDTLLKEHTLSDDTLEQLSDLSRRGLRYGTADTKVVVRMSGANAIPKAGTSNNQHPFRENCGNSAIIVDGEAFLSAKEVGPMITALINVASALGYRDCESVSLADLPRLAREAALYREDAEKAAKTASRT